MKFLFFFILLSFSFSSFAQRQLLLLKNGKVLHRFYPGDDIYIKIKGNADRTHSYLNNILEDAIVLQQDTIPFRSIERTFIYESERRNVNGAQLVAAGVLLFGIDFVNQQWVQKTDYKATSGISIASGVFIAGGLPLMLIKKKSQLISYKYRLLMVKVGDPLYR
jgi:hypothetical protein